MTNVMFSFISKGQFDPLFGGQEKAVPSRLISNSLEFEVFKIGVVDPLPDAKKQDGVLVLEPLLNQRASSIEIPHHVSERNKVSAWLQKDTDGCSLNLDRASFCFAHGVDCRAMPG